MTEYSLAFLKAVESTLKNEGVLSDDPDDPGGITKFGVSLRFALAALGGDADFNQDGIVDGEDIRSLTKEQAIEIYHTHWWLKYGYDQINNHELAGKIFDLAVNMGGVQAHRCVQRALRACCFPVIEDGKIGPLTIAALNAVDPRCLLSALRSEAAGTYRTIIAKNPPLSKYLGGWLKRAYL